MDESRTKNMRTVEERDRALATHEGKDLEEFKKDLMRLPVLRLTLAYELSEADAEFYLDWVAGNLGEGILVDFELDAGIIGGAVISFEGKYLDHSLKRRLETYESEAVQSESK